jgi:hypothetical protein
MLKPTYVMPAIKMFVSICSITVKSRADNEISFISKKYTNLQIFASNNTFLQTLPVGIKIATDMLRSHLLFTCVHACKQPHEHGRTVKLSLQQAVEAYKIVRCVRIPHFLDNRLTDGRKIINLMHPPRFPSPPPPKTGRFLVLVLVRG